MDFLEKDLERIIFETDNKVLNEKGLRISGKKLRQVRLGNYGVADLITIARNFKIYEDYSYHIVVVTVYELKLAKVGVSAFLQAVGYAKAISSFCEKKYPGIPVTVIISLCGRSVDNSGSFCYIPSVVNGVSFTTYDYGVDGIIFSSANSFALINEGF